MGIRKNTFIICIMVIMAGCTATRVSSKPGPPPTKSFVKILHTTQVYSCKNKKDPNCPIGSFTQTGSGIAVDISPHMTVLTAGHVCDSQPTKAIDKVNQTTYVLDHTNTIHQAWPVAISFNNNLGSSDLCLLWVPTLNVEKVKISNTPPRVGDDIYYIGAPLGIYHPPTVPILKGTFSGKIDASSSMATFPTIGGASGAGVFNSRNQVIGVVFAANTKFHHVGLITDFETTVIFLQNSKKRLKIIQ